MDGISVQAEWNECRNRIRFVNWQTPRTIQPSNLFDTLRAVWLLALSISFAFSLYYFLCCCLGYIFLLLLTDQVVKREHIIIPYSNYIKWVNQLPKPL